MADSKKIETIFESAVANAPQFAITAAYLAGDSEPVVLTAGPTAKGGRAPVSNSAPWHIGSITKSFTATLIMRLVDRRDLSLDAPISTYLPKYTEKMHVDWQTATLRQLLSHSAGLPANAPRKSFKSNLSLDPVQGRHVVLSELWAKPAPGAKGTFSYSNIGYVLAGIVAEEVTGQNWETLIKIEIADPLGFHSLGFGAPKQVDAARGHKNLMGFKTPSDPEKLTSDNPRWMGPAGTLHLSMAELVQWGKVHIQACRGELPNFLSEASCREMQTAIANDYGLGWVVSTNENAGPIFWHNGSNTMWYAIVTAFPEKDVVVAVATNIYAPARAEALMHEISAQLVGELE